MVDLETPWLSTHHGKFRDLKELDQAQLREAFEVRCQVQNDLKEARIQILT